MGGITCCCSSPSLRPCHIATATACIPHNHSEPQPNQGVTFEIKGGAAIAAVNGDRQADGCAIIHLVSGCHRANLHMERARRGMAWHGIAWLDVAVTWRGCSTGLHSMAAWQSKQSKAFPAWLSYLGQALLLREGHQHLPHRQFGVGLQRKKANRRQQGRGEDLAFPTWMCACACCSVIGWPRGSRVIPHPQRAACKLVAMQVTGLPPPGCASCTPAPRAARTRQSAPSPARCPWCWRPPDGYKRWMGPWRMHSMQGEPPAPCTASGTSPVPRCVSRP